jgi:uncharacterized PurR-regulated membrane protein YhhQ (DUF165 family)
MTRPAAQRDGAAPNGILVLAVVAMVLVVAASNVAVQHPFTPFGLQDVLTWGAFTYPFAFLVTDLTNRWAGPVAARRVVYAGFALGVVLSALLAEPRIAAASGAAFLAGQLLDITVFNRMRQASWWKAPLASSALGSAVDTGLFFGLAFAGTDVPWHSLALGDLAVKLTYALVLLAPFRAALAWRATPAPLAP